MAQGGCGTVIPSPPFVYYPQGQNSPSQPVVPGTQALPIAPGQGPVTGPEELKRHRAKQDPDDPTHAFDSTTGQNLSWDSSTNTWTDSQTGQSLGFDGVQTATGTVIPAPPIMYYPQGQNQPNQPVVPGTQALPIAPGQGPVTGPEELKSHQAKQDPNDPTHAFDSTTGQNLFWDSSKNSWVDSQTGQSVGFNGACINTPPTNAPATPPSTPTPPANNTSPTTSKTQPAPHSPVSMSGFTPTFQLRGFGGPSFIHGNTPATSGFDGALLFPLGNRVLVGPTAGFQWINSSIVNSIGTQQPGSTFIHTSTGFKNGNFGGQIQIPFMFAHPTGVFIDIHGGATVANSTITQQSGFCGLGNATSPAGCHVLSTTTSHDTVVGPFLGGYISHSIFPHVGVFAGYDYLRLKDTTSAGTTGSSTGSQNLFDEHYNLIEGGIQFCIGHFKDAGPLLQILPECPYVPNAAYTTD